MATGDDDLNQSPQYPRNLRKSRREDDDYAAWQEAEAAYAEEEERRQAEEEAENRTNAITEMSEWFFTQFEDPQNDTPRPEGEYLYLWGGPFDASEVLHDNFGEDYSEEWIESAVEEIERDGTMEWAPSPNGDYYEHPDEPDPEPPTRAQLLEQIATLKEQLNELPTKADKLGHNQPPEEIGAPPYGDEDRDEINQLLDETAEEVSSDEPNENRLKKLTEKLGEYASIALKYGGQKLDLFVDETIKKAVSVGTVYFWFGDALNNLIAGIASSFGL